MVAHARGGRAEERARGILIGGVADEELDALAPRDPARVEIDDGRDHPHERAAGIVEAFGPLLRVVGPGGPDGVVRRPFGGHLVGGAIRHAAL